MPHFADPVPTAPLAARADLDTAPGAFAHPTASRPVMIGEDVQIGIGAIIMKCVRIGAGAVVTGDVPAGATLAGTVGASWPTR